MHKVSRVCWPSCHGRAKGSHQVDRGWSHTPTQMQWCSSLHNCVNVLEETLAAKLVELCCGLRDALSWQWRYQTIAHQIGCCVDAWYWAAAWVESIGWNCNSSHGDQMCPLDSCKGCEVWQTGWHTYYTRMPKAFQTALSDMWRTTMETHKAFSAAPPPLGLVSRIQDHETWPM